MFRELGNVVENQLVGVSRLIDFFLVRVGHHATNDLGDGVLELRVTSELLPFLCVLVLVCHYFFCYRSVIS